MNDACDIHRELLPEYVNDELSDALRQSVEEHLETCRACQQTLRMLRMISQSTPIENDWPDDHVSSELLSRYALQPESISPAERGAVDEHLQGCEACRAELQFVQDVNRDISLDVAAGPQRRPATSFRNRLRTVFSHPVIAYAILLIALIPAILWVVQRDRIVSTSAITSYTGPVELRTMTRSPANIPTVQVPPDTPVVLFDIPLTRMNAGFDYSFAVIDMQTEAPVEAPVIPIYDSTGTTGLLADCSRLTAGIYYLRVTETDRASGEIITRRDFAFKIRESGETSIL